MTRDSDSLNSYQKEVDRIEIEYFTDPLCCWSWAFEPHWRRFVNEHKDSIRWRYRMGGMITDWSNYSDPMNDITRPAQMAPLWLQVKYTTHTDINPDIWIEDPPQTSIPACLAVKCAEIQSQAAADVLLLTLRKAVMTQKKNIAKKAVILELANEIEQNYKVLDYAKFVSDFENNSALTALKTDLQKAKLADIGRFPTITMQKADQPKGLLVVGYRPYSVLVDAFNQLTGVLTHQD